MTISHWERTTVDAVNNILDGLSGSDFVSMCGSHAITELVLYRLDIAISIWKAWFEREPTEQEKIDMRDMLDKRWEEF